MIDRLTVFFTGVSRRLVHSPATRRMVLYCTIASLLCFMMTLSAFFYVGSQPAEVKQEEVILSYEHRGGFDYVTYLKPSQLYGEISPEAALARYPAAVLEKIDFSYTFRPADKSASSGKIEAVLETPGIWQRSVIFKSDSSTGEDLTFYFTLDAGYFRGLFEETEKALSLNGQPRLITLIASIDTAGGSFVQTLPVNFGSDMIELGSSLRLTKFPGTGTFDYIVHNRTSPEKLTYPVQIIDRFDFTFTYDAPMPEVVTGRVDAVFANSGVWEKTMNLAETTGADGRLVMDFPVDINNFRNTFTRVENETGIASSSRDVIIKAYASSANYVFFQSLSLSLKDTLVEIGNNLNTSEPAGAGSFSYRVRLKPNSIFTESTIQVPAPEATPGDEPAVVMNTKPPEVPVLTSVKPGEPVFLKLVDNMNVVYTYQLTSGKPLSNVMTDVVIDATIEAPALWSKTFRLLDAKKTGRFNLTFPVEVGYYSSLMDAIRTETGVSAETYNLKVTVNVHARADSTVGKIDEVFTQELQGTFKNSILQWDKQLTKEQPGAISKARLLANPARYLGLSLADMKSLSLWLACIFLPLFIFSLLVFVTAQPERLSTEEKELLDIKKKYGQRISEARDLSSGVAEQYVRMSSMADLVAIADELGKPIIHQLESSPSGSHIYFVLDAATGYEYRVDNVAVRNA